MIQSLSLSSPHAALDGTFAQERTSSRQPSFLRAIQALSLGMCLPKVCATSRMNATLVEHQSEPLNTVSFDQLEGVLISLSLAYISLYEHQSLACQLALGAEATEVSSQPHAQTYIPNLARALTASYLPMISVSAGHALTATAHSISFENSSNRTDARQYAALGAGIIGSLALVGLLPSLKHAHQNTHSTRAQQKFLILLHTLNTIQKPLGRILGPLIGALLLRNNQTLIDTAKLTGLAYVAMGPCDLLVDYLESILHAGIHTGLEAWRTLQHTNTPSLSIASDRLKDKLAQLAQVAGINAQDLEDLLPPALAHIAICPTSLQIMTDPVILAREDVAHIFERSSAKTWIDRRGTHPLDPSFSIPRNTVLPSLKSLQSQIEHWVDEELARRRA